MKHCFLSLMVQFVPPRENDEKFAPMSDMEYDILINALEELGIEDGFIQERGDEILWIPDFRKDWDPVYGDRMQKLVFIGQKLDKEQLTKDLDFCLAEK